MARIAFTSPCVSVAPKVPRTNRIPYHRVSNIGPRQKWLLSQSMEAWTATKDICWKDSGLALPHLAVPFFLCEHTWGRSGAAPNAFFLRSAMPNSEAGKHPTPGRAPGNPYGRSVTAPHVRPGNSPAERTHTAPGVVGCSGTHRLESTGSRWTQRRAPSHRAALWGSQSTPVSLFETTTATTAASTASTASQATPAATKAIAAAPAATTATTAAPATATITIATKVARAATTTALAATTAGFQVV